MSDLTDFLLARIAEDEAWARALMGEDWSQGPDSSRPSGPKRGLYRNHGEKHLANLWDANAATHIARHDPARVLAECEAKRRIMESVERALPRGTNGLGPSMIFHLAAIYADHPDYRDEWRP